MFKTALAAAAIVGVAATSPVQGFASDHVASRLEGTEIIVPHKSSWRMHVPHPSNGGSQAEIAVHFGQVLATVGETTFELANFASAEDLWNGEVRLLIWDVNQDGYDDIGIIDGVGYAGVNYFWKFFLAESQSGFPFLGIISNPSVDLGSGRVYSPSRSGPLWTTSVYDLSSGTLDLVFERAHYGEYDRIIFSAPGNADGPDGIVPVIAPDPIDASALETLTYRQDAIAIEPRVYFHNEPDPATRRNGYLVEGDVGEVLDVTSDQGWMYVTFTHSQTRRTTRGWLRVGEMVFIQG